MYDALAYIALVMVAAGAVLLLAWFGNYTARVYANLYGHIPKPPQIHDKPIERVYQGQERVEYYPSAYTACSVVAMCSVISAVPGGITFMR